MSSFRISLLLLAISVRAKAALHLTTVPLSAVFSKSLGMAFITLSGYACATLPMIRLASHFTLGATSLRCSITKSSQFSANSGFSLVMYSIASMQAPFSAVVHDSKHCISSLIWLLSLFKASAKSSTVSIGFF